MKNDARTRSARRLKRWTSRSIGSRFQHRIFYALIRAGGIHLAYPLLYAVVFYYMTCRPSIRQKTAFYLEKRFPQKSAAQRFADSYRISMTLGKVLIERAKAGIRGPETLKLSFPAKARLFGLLEENRGLILMNAHVGGWQVILPALPSLGRPVKMLIERDAQDVDLHYYEHAHRPRPFAAIDPKGFLGGSLEMMDALERGEILCVMGDRVFGSDKNVIHVPFLGKRAVFPFSAFKIASVSGAPVAVFFSHRIGPNRYGIEIPDVIRVPAGLGRSPRAFGPYVHRFVAALDAYTREHPYQFFNFYDMWTES
ncbi:MAG: lysophospholipid acyltransferase family protein [Deltaproteobacteria bacterium]|nr:lysophospholipid acyltransferase family protein [Deltaproteobacteria bacterium]